MAFVLFRSLRGKVKANTRTSSQLFSDSHTVVPALEKHDSLEVLKIGMDCPVEPKVRWSILKVTWHVSKEI